MASEEMSFENVDRRQMPTDGRQMPAYTISSPMSLRLRRVKKCHNEPMFSKRQVRIGQCGPRLVASEAAVR